VGYGDAGGAQDTLYDVIANSFSTQNYNRVAIYTAEGAHPPSPCGPIGRILAQHKIVGWRLGAAGDITGGCPPSGKSARSPPSSVSLALEVRSVFSV
jgi:hypothetical protein